MDAMRRAACSGALCLLVSVAIADAGQDAQLVHSALDPVDLECVLLEGGTGVTKDLLGGKVYYPAASNVVIEGSNGSDDNPNGACALKVESGKTAYICIPEGYELTCRGGRGADAKPGKDGSSPKWTYKAVGLQGITYPWIDFAKEATAGGAGGSSAGGGGAGILVPDDSRLVIFGKGRLSVYGGAGGAAGNGADNLTASGVCYWVSFANDKGGGLTNGLPAKNMCKIVRSNLARDFSTGWGGVVSKSYFSQWSFMNHNPSSGGGGGGGAGGGGAAIGSCGAPGSSGAAGGAVTNNWEDASDDGLKATPGEGGRRTVPSSEWKGTVLIDSDVQKNLLLEGGSGGKLGARPPKKADWTFLGDYYTTDYADRGPENVYFTEGQPGGGGGAGGNGAAIGAGGHGGAGGAGGDSGSVVDSACNGKNTYCDNSSVGANGTDAASGGGKSADNLAEDQIPYSTVRFLTNGQAESNVYRLAKNTLVTLPNDNRARWLTVWAKTLSGVAPGSSALLETDRDTSRLPGTTLWPASGTYGDVTLSDAALTVRCGGTTETPLYVDTSSSFFSGTLESGQKGLSAMRTTLAKVSASTGLRNWQNYVLGLDQTDGNAAIRIAAESRPDGRTGVRIRPIKKIEPRANTGFSVSYQLASPGAEPGAPVSSQEFDVGLPESGGRYRLGVQIKADSAGNAADVIPAENEVGVVRVGGGVSNVVVGVPFSGYDGGQTTVSNLLPATAIPANTELFCCADGGAYERWTGGGAYAWTAQNTFKAGKDGTMPGALSMSADQRQVANGTGLWLSQKNGNANAICLFGSVPTNGVAAKIVTTVTNGTAALVANPHETGKALKITDAAAGDTIQLPTSAGPLRTYRCRPNASGQMEWASWENGTSKVGLPEIPAGTGFWYVSMGLKEVKISWE